MNPEPPVMSTRIVDTLVTERPTLRRAVLASDRATFGSRNVFVLL